MESHLQRLVKMVRGSDVWVGLSLELISSTHLPTHLTSGPASPPIYPGTPQANLFSWQKQNLMLLPMICFSSSGISKSQSLKFYMLTPQYLYSCHTERIVPYSIPP